MYPRLLLILPSCCCPHLIFNFLPRAVPPPLALSLPHALAPTLCSKFLMATQFASLFPPSACSTSDDSDFLVGTILGFASAALTAAALLLLALRWRRAQLLITLGTALVLPALSSAAMAIACAVSFNAGNSAAAASGAVQLVDSGDHVCPSPPAPYALASAGLALAVTGVGLPCITAWHTLRGRSPELASDFSSHSWWAAHVLQAEALLFVLLQLGSRTLGVVQAAIACSAAVGVLALALLRRPWRPDLRWKQWTESLVQCCLFAGVLLSATRSLAAAWATFLLEISLIVWLFTIFALLSLQSLPAIAHLRQSGAAPPANATLIVRAAYSVVRTLIGAEAPPASASGGKLTDKDGTKAGLGGRGRVRVSVSVASPSGGLGPGGHAGSGKDSSRHGRIRVRAEPLASRDKAAGAAGDSGGLELEGKQGVPASAALPGVTMRSNPLQVQQQQQLPRRQRDARRSQMAPTAIAGARSGADDPSFSQGTIATSGGGLGSGSGLRTRTLRLTEDEMLTASDGPSNGAGNDSSGRHLLEHADGDDDDDDARYRHAGAAGPGPGPSSRSRAGAGGFDRGGFAPVALSGSSGGSSSGGAGSAAEPSSSGSHASHASLQMYRSGADSHAARGQHGRRNAARATRASFARAGISATPTLTRAASSTNRLSTSAAPAGAAGSSATSADAAASPAAGRGAVGSATASSAGRREPGAIVRR